MITLVKSFVAKRNPENGFDVDVQLSCDFKNVATAIRWLKDNEDCLVATSITTKDEASGATNTYTSIRAYVKEMLDAGVVKAVPYILLQPRRITGAVDDPVRVLRFQNLSFLRDKYGDDWEPDPSLYTVAYEGVVYVDAENVNPQSINDILWSRFNGDARPNRLYACSMSVSDINIIDGEAYYVGSYGFDKLKNFNWESVFGDGKPVKKERLHRFMLTGDLDGMADYLRNCGVDLV